MFGNRQLAVFERKMSSISERKRCQKKRKDVDYKLLKEFFQKNVVVHKQLAVENSDSTYICYAPDGLFWLNLYKYVPEISHLHFRWRTARNCRKMMEGFYIFKENRP